LMCTPRRDSPPFSNELIVRALTEDSAWMDQTSLGLPDCHKRVQAVIVAKEDLIIAGLAVAAQTFRILAEGNEVWQSETGDGKRVKAGNTIACLDAEAWVILAGERTALNFLQRLCGIATLTNKFIERVAGTGAMIVDTRKTTPGVRMLEKYAVRCGGGLNHRFGLNDGCLIKDNHIRVAGGITQAVSAIRNTIPHLWRIEVEVESMNQVEECLDLGVEAVLLDNMSIPDMTKAVALIKGRMLIEASGGITLENVSEIARTGVDLISVGALTHSAPSVDISLEMS